MNFSPENLNKMHNYLDRELENLKNCNKNFENSFFSSSQINEKNSNFSSNQEKIIGDPERVKMQDDLMKLQNNILNLEKKLAGIHSLSNEKNPLDKESITTFGNQIIAQSSINKFGKVESIFIKKI